jgi:hypothetical protein
MLATTPTHSPPHHEYYLPLNKFVACRKAIKKYVFFGSAPRSKTKEESGLKSLRFFGKFINQMSHWILPIAEEIEGRCSLDFYINGISIKWKEMPEVRKDFSNSCVVSLTLVQVIIYHFIKEIPLHNVEILKFIPESLMCYYYKVSSLDGSNT